MRRDFHFFPTFLPTLTVVATKDAKRDGPQTQAIRGFLACGFVINKGREAAEIHARLGCGKQNLTIIKRGFLK
jgi:hypothetical protein